MLHCKICNFAKESSEFYKSCQTRCKDCVKKASRENRKKNIEHYRAYDRDRGNRQPKSYLASYRKANRKKYQAHNKVNNALRDGKIQKEPCEVCGEQRSVAHHDDYDKPLDVRWLCQGHHKQWHAIHGEAKNAR